MANLVQFPFEYFPDPTKGRPVWNGYIYVGQPDTDPIIPINRVPVRALLENGGELLLAQPFRTNSGGVPVYQGSPVRVVTDTTYSIAIHNSKNERVYYAANAKLGDSFGDSVIAFETVSDLQADVSGVLSVGAIVTTAKYNANVAQTWLMVGVEPVGQNYVPVGAIWALDISPNKTFEHFGAYADGVTNDSAAFIKAKDFEGIVNGSGAVYKITSTVGEITSSWHGNNSTILLQSCALGVVNGGFIGGFIVDGGGTDCTAYPLAIKSPSENSRIGDMTYQNIHGQSSFQTYPLYIPVYGAQDFSVGNQTFINITQDDDGAVTGKGFVGGIYLVGLDADVPNGKSNGRIGNVHGDTIKSVDAGSGVVQDADLIRAFCETTTTDSFDITIGNVTGRNVAKRLVKVSSLGGLNIGDVSAVNLDNSLPMHAVVELLSSAINCTLGDIRGTGYGDRIAWIKGRGNQVGNVHDHFGSQAVIFGEAGNQAVSCQVGNVLGRGNFATGGTQGYGVQIIDADKCQVGDISGLFAIAYNAETTNTGRNKVGAINCNGRVAHQAGGASVLSITADITGEPVAGTHYVFSAEFNTESADIITDGRVTAAAAGAVVDVDLGKFKIRRATSANGVESNHSVFTTASATGGKLRGNLDVEVNAVVGTTASGTAGKSLIYITGCDVEDFSASVNVTATSRGATGYGIYMNNVRGQASRIAHKGAYATGVVGMQLTGDLTITKVEQLVENSTLTLGGTTAAYLVEKRATTTISGGLNTPTSINTTRA